MQKDFSIKEKIEELENILIDKYGYRKGKDGFIEDPESKDLILSSYSYFTQDNLLITLNNNLLPKGVYCYELEKFNRLSNEEKSILNELLELKYSDLDLEIK